MEHTMELVRQAQDGDKEAMERIVRENSGLVWSVVKRFANRGYELDDLFQIGAIGMLKCVQKFDPSYDVKFSTYAVPMIMGEIKRFIRDDGMIKVSRPIKELAAKARYAQEAMVKRLGYQPAISELAAEVGVSVEELVVALESGMEVESLYSSVTQGDGAPVYLIDKLDQDKDGENHMLDSIALKQVIGKLKPKERQIIMMRYYDDKTQTEIAREIGVSQVQVSRIERKALKNLREGFG